VAVFRVEDAVHAIGNHDPASGANVLSRGIVGDIGGEVVVASPIYKQHFSLVTGRCLEEPSLSVPVYLTRVVGSEVWVRCEAVKLHRPARKPRLVIVGNGLVAQRTLEELLELAPGVFEITIFDAEPEPRGYNRILLSPLLAGKMRVDDIVTHPPEWYAKHGITLRSGDPIVQVDRVHRLVQSRRGVEAGYDRLLIATGSLPIRLSVPGADLPGVMTFRELEDVRAMLAAAKTHRRAIVIGGGLLGVEAAESLRLRGMEVTVVHLATHLMERQLDPEGATLLQRELENRGLKFILGARTSEILGKHRVVGICLADGRQLPADLIVTAVGIRPNIDLAKAAGLRCDRGILVDDTLLTYDPAIYAVGECVQHREHTFGLVAPLWDQARVCAAYLAERGVRRYGGATLSTHLKVSGIELFAAGDCAESASSESVVLRDSKRGVYKRLIIENGKVRGAVLYGDTREGSWFADLIKEGRDVRLFRDQLFFGAAAKSAVPRTSKPDRSRTSASLR
jgi:nitrite reductase (NADH) large subunit